MKSKNSSSIASLRQQETGFSLIELLIVMAIFVIAMAVSASVFTSMLGPAKSQARIAETQIEGIVGLETLRSDLEHAGYGLPWGFPNGYPIVYGEAVGAGMADPAVGFNEANAPFGNVPRALGGNTVAPNIAGSSYLVIRAANIAQNDFSLTWTKVGYGGVITGLTGLGSDRPQNGAGVIVLNTQPDTKDSKSYRQLIMSGGAFSVQYNDGGLPAGFAPPDPPKAGEGGVLYVVYGIDNNAPLLMPFNRADYFISLNGVPSSCAPGTGVLAKNTLAHNGGVLNPIPLIDCVGGFYVLFGLDTNNDGVPDSWTPNINSGGAVLSPEQIRQQIVEVRVYILMHEGRRDPGFNFSGFTGAGSAMRLGDPALGAFWDVPLATFGANFQNYRWKVITMVVTPKNLK